jgi:hypothetical protein
MNLGQLASRSAFAGGIGALCLVVGGLGVATAANGGSLVLGHHNSATSTTTLKDSKGTPLSLIGKKSKPPLKVNSSKQVAHLNASLLGGLSASAVKSTGSGAITPTNTSEGEELPLPTESTGLIGQLIASTGKLPHGTYYVNASVMVQEGDTEGVICDLYVAGAARAVQYSSTPDLEQLLTTSLSGTVTVSNGQKIGVYCFDDTGGTNPSPDTVFDGGITAIKTGTEVAGSITHAAIAHAAKHSTSGFGR